jgi:broad specificity phosphatase PhoE
MGKLILVRHSAVQRLDHVPPSQWRLSDDGRQRCAALARLLAPLQPVAVISSHEPKAVETAELVARQLDLPCSIADGLHEHERSNVRLMSAAALQANVQQFFQRPDDLVFGDETATQAVERLGEGIAAALAAWPDQTVAIVTHGTVLSLFAAEHNRIDSYTLWSKLGLPAFLVLDRPTFAVAHIVATFE